MKLMDDIGGLHQLIPNRRTAEIVLSQQIKHVNRVLPYFLGGILITAFIFFVMMESTLHQSLLLNPLHLIWITYHSITLVICWYLWNKVLDTETQITRRFIKKVFIYLFVFFLAANVFGLFTFFLDVYYSLISIESGLFIIWFIYHNLALYLCYSSWKNVDQVIYQTRDKGQMAAVETAGVMDKVFSKSKFEHQADYLVSYSAYRVLFTCMLLIGCLWAIAVAKVLTTEAELSIQMIVLIGLNFAIISGAMSSFGIFKQAFNAFAMPSLFTWAALLLYLQDPQLIILALAVIIFIFTHSYFAKHNWLTSIKTIQVFLENTQLVSKLETKSRQLEKVSSAKTQFLASASHDLRQPAHALNLFIETLSRTNLDEKQRNIVEYAKTASQSSSNMLNTILDYSHLESGEMIPNIVATKLDPLIQSLIDEFSAEAELKGIKLKYRRTDVCVKSDPAMLSLILRNFISNAIRYTVQGGVLVGVRFPSETEVTTIYDEPSISDKPSCRVAVWDTGSGIKADEITRIFDSFHQLERSTQTNQGLGLGLSIAHGLSKLLHAPINVLSEFGRGSQFYIDLPLCKTEEERNINTGLISFEQPSKTVVLIIDDDETVLVSMRLLLESWGYKVIVAHNVEVAVKQYQLYQPQMLITDYQLGDYKTGDEVIKTLKAVDSLKGIVSTMQCLILTGDTSPEIIKISKAMQVSLLHKPIAPNVLRDKLTDLVAML